METFKETIRSLGSPLWSETFDFLGNWVKIARWQHTGGRVAFAAPDMVRIVINLASSPLVHHTEGSKTISVKSLPGSISVMLPFIPTETVICGPADVVQLFFAPEILKTFSTMGTCRSSKTFPYWELKRQTLRFLLETRLQSDSRISSRLPGIEMGLASLLTAFSTRSSSLDYQPVFNPPAVQRVEGLIRDAVRDAKPLEVKMMARVAGWSPTHLSRVLREKRGIAPHQLLLMRRLERAMDLLLEPTLQVAEIADAVGFSSPAYFTAYFRQRLGITPGAYRRALQPALATVSEKRFVF